MIFGRRRNVFFFPKDILIFIFSQLENYKTFFRCRQVCKDWKIAISLALKNNQALHQLLYTLHLNCDNQRFNPYLLYVFRLNKKNKDIQCAYCHQATLACHIPWFDVPIYCCTNVLCLVKMMLIKHYNFCTCDERPPNCLRFHFKEHLSELEE